MTNVIKVVTIYWKRNPHFHLYSHFQKHTSENLYFERLYMFSFIEYSPYESKASQITELHPKEHHMFWPIFQNTLVFLKYYYNYLSILLTITFQSLPIFQDKIPQRIPHISLDYSFTKLLYFLHKWKQNYINQRHHQSEELIRGSRQCCQLNKHK